jgi:hypothetical protein
MSSRTGMIIGLVLLLLGSAVSAAPKSGVRVTPLDTTAFKDLRFTHSFAAAEVCTVGNDAPIAYYIDGWVAGAELYKSYVDPSSGCSGPYPFTITQINMPMRFQKACSLTVSVDVEGVDYSDPSCPVPGVLQALSSDWMLSVPAAGGYNIWIPLDSPVVVNGPFFAGVYLANVFDTSVGAAIYCDNVPQTCYSYNIWDTTIGFIDLVNNDYWNFPGRLAMYVIGSPGGQGVQPEPEVSLLRPLLSDTLFASTDLWAWEQSGSTIIDYVSFAYSSGGAYTEIGRDYDGTRPLRDGVNPADAGSGYSINWDFSALTAGTYVIKATAVDTLGRTASDSVTVKIEPTAPVARIVSPADGSDFCTPLNLLMQTSDANLSSVTVYRTNAQPTYSLNLALLDQQTLGDVNGNPNDGNHASTGEYGDYYSGPAAAAVAAKAWADRGYTSIMREGFSTLTVGQLAERLATEFKTRENKGTYDENLYSGLRSYFTPRGNVFLYDYLRKPDYYAMRSWIEDDQRTAVLGLGDAPGLWVAVNGFTGWVDSAGNRTLSIMNPLTGLMVDAPLRVNLGTSELSLDGVWHTVDIMVSLRARTWTVTRTLVGADSSGADGWSVAWTPSGLTEGNPYIFHAVGRDAQSFQGVSTYVGRYTCASAYKPGDFNDDGLADILDLQILVEFMSHNGQPPIGGAGRADCNCDHNVDIADVVYYINFLFGTASAPCY